MEVNLSNLAAQKPAAYDSSSDPVQMWTSPQHIEIRLHDAIEGVFDWDEQDEAITLYIKLVRANPEGWPKR